MKNSAKKLNLNKMTISNLGSSELSLKIGGKGTGPNCIVLSKSCIAACTFQSGQVKCPGVIKK